MAEGMRGAAAGSASTSQNVTAGRGCRARKRSGGSGEWRRGGGSRAMCSASELPRHGSGEEIGEEGVHTYSVAGDGDGGSGDGNAGVSLPAERLGPRRAGRGYCPGAGANGSSHGANLSVKSRGTDRAWRLALRGRRLRRTDE